MRKSPPDTATAWRIINDVPSTLPRHTLLYRLTLIVCGTLIYARLTTFAQHTTSASSHYQSQSYVVLPYSTVIIGSVCVIVLVTILAYRWKAYKVLNAQLQQHNRALIEANTEIARQQRILEDQATEIELTNSELVEYNLRLERLNTDIQTQLHELETLDTIVKTINRESDFFRLLDILLKQGHLLVPSAERSSVLALDHTTRCYRFIAFQGYNPDDFRHITLSEEEMHRRYISTYGLEGGVYVVNEFPSHTPEGQKFTIAPPLSALLITIPIDGVMEGILFFDNFSTPNAFSLAEIERCKRYREHVIAAFAKARNLAELQNIAEELASRNTALQQLNIEKNELLGIAAHDMKNPLAQITMQAGALKRYAHRMSTQEIASKAEQIEATALRMSRIISQLLDINAIETGTMQMQLTAIPIAYAVETVVADLRAIANRKDIALINEFALETTALRVLADPLALQSIIENLGSNAIKYSPPKSNIYFRLIRRDNTVRLTVQDEGPGISSEDMPKLFGKFVRLSAQPTGGESSTGLGLSIVKRLVEALHGTIWCESDYGHGASFIVELPLCTDKLQPVHCDAASTLLSENSVLYHTL
ncbi:MAG: HAMP domain-containing histidine kinase [Candidatus Kapabacteria bacterium]|nr:HAMP domain-containing histidine kinase [Candidatus Kapabacteria bacterium]